MTHDPIDEADLYGRVDNPEWIKRLADDEWRDMDEYGRLPDGWVQPEEEL